MTIVRTPDTCPNHPDSGMVKTTVRDLGNPYNSIYRERLTQHLCAEPGCNKGLGWLYESPRRHSKGGAGICQDQRVLNHLKRVQLKPDTGMHLWMTSLTGTLVMSIALCGGAASEWHAASLGAIGAVAAAIATATTAALLHRKRQKAENCKARNTNSLKPSHTGTGETPE